MLNVGRPLTLKNGFVMLCSTGGVCQLWFIMLLLHLSLSSVNLISLRPASACNSLEFCSRAVKHMVIQAFVSIFLPISDTQTSPTPLGFTH